MKMLSLKDINEYSKKDLITLKKKTSLFLNLYQNLRIKIEKKNFCLFLSN